MDDTSQGLDQEGIGEEADTARLARWRDAGGWWRVLVRTPTSLTVALLTCDGGEEMERIISSDPAFVAYVSALPSDQ